jgi:hypothetical protein
MTNTIATTTNAGIEAERACDFLRTNPRSARPRHEGLTEIRGPYSSVGEGRHLQRMRNDHGSTHQLQQGGA